MDEILNHQETPGMMISLRLKTEVMVSTMVSWVVPMVTKSLVHRTKPLKVKSF